MATSVKNGNGKQGSKQQAPQKQRPVFSKKYWPVQVAVFEFRNGERLNHSIELTRSFRRDEESEWETTHYLQADDLLQAAKLLEDAYSVIQSRIQGSVSTRTSGDTEEIPY